MSAASQVNDDDNNIGAVPHTFGAYNHVTEVEHLESMNVPPTRIFNGFILCRRQNI